MVAACLDDPEVRQRLPEDFSFYLDFIHAENTRRNRALRAQLGEAAACLNRIGIEPLLLKGAIRLVDGLYPDPGWRFMRDLDLLVPRDRIEQAVACLASLGYRFPRNVTETPPDYKHLPPLCRDGAGAVLEIHTGLLDLRDVCPAEHVVARSRPVDLDGVRARVPDPADQIAHLICHDRFDAQLRHSGMFLLRNVFEAALLCHKERSLLHLLAHFAGTPLAHYARVRLAVAAYLFPDYLTRPLDVGLADRLLARALINVEHLLEQLDENGRLRRFVGYVNLLGSPAWRQHFAANIRSPDYRRHCVQRLCSLWSGG
jgi:hypothetical protein